MRFVVRLVCALLLLLLLIYVLAVFSWWLTGFALLAAALVLVAKYSDRGWTAFALAVVAMIGLWLSAVIGLLPGETRAAGCETTATARVATALAGAAGSADQASRELSSLDMRKLTIRRDAERILFQAQQAVDADILLLSIDRVLELPSAPGLEEPRQNTNNGSSEIRAFLKQNELNLKDKRKESYAALAKKIASITEQVKAETQSSRMESHESRLFEAQNESILWLLAQKMFSLQESMLALTRQSVTAAPTFSAAWEESRGRAAYREEITLTSQQDALFNSVDASQLFREAQMTAEAGQISRLKENGRYEKVDDPAYILIAPMAKTVTLLYERYQRPDVIPYCNIAPFSTIQRLRFSWPATSPSIRMRANLASGDLRLPVWFSLDRSKAESQSVKEIRLPVYSFFASGLDLQPTVSGEDDLLKPGGQGAIPASHLDARRENWIEVLANRWPLRTSFTRRFQHYLIWENAFAATLAFALAALLTIFFPRWKS